MVELEENLRFLSNLKTKLYEVKSSMNIDDLKIELDTLKKSSEEENFWQNQEKSTAIFSKIKKIEKNVNTFMQIECEINNLFEMNEFLLIELDVPMAKEVIVNSKNIENLLKKLEIETLLSGKYDTNNAIITLHPGAGGTESQDWVQMLYRMYGKWASSNGYILKELDYLDGDEAGIKSVTALISGENAYGYLKCEMGVHRLVRISPFDSGGRRHTSFASLEVLPEITDDIEVDINQEDLRIDTYRASRSRRATY